VSLRQQVPASADINLRGHYQGRVLSMIAKLINPKTILEIGTYTGYSALCLAEGLQKEGILHTIDVNEPGTYTIEVTNTIGCVGTDDIVLTEDPAISLDIGDNQILCSDETATITATPNDCDTYTWTVNGIVDSNTTDTLTLSGSGEYDVVLDVTRGTCSASATVHITILDPVTITATPVVYGELDIAADGGQPPYQYSLDGSSYTSDPVFSGFTNYPVLRAPFLNSSKCVINNNNESLSA